MVVRILAGLILVYAALLRFDALTLIHGPVLTPAWIGAVQETRPAVSAWRPGPMTWERWEGRYISDPYTYSDYYANSYLNGYTYCYTNSISDLTIFTR